MLGRDKLLEPVSGRPVLGVLAARALEVGPVFVTLPDLDHPRRRVVPETVQCVPVLNAHNGMSHSLRAGVSALPDAAIGVLILPADMPDITAADMATITTHAHRGTHSIVRATTSDGKPGHPIYFARHLFPLFETLEGDRGAFQICRDHVANTEFVPLNGQQARLDLDTPAAWDTYRKGLTT